MAKRRALILCFILLFVSSYALAQDDAYLFSNFTAGELTRKLDSRMDFNKFFNGARTLENMIVYPQGGASKRPGFKFIHEAKFSDKESRLIPFVFSDTQAYILEFGDEYIRFYMDGGIIVEDGFDLISTGGFEGGVTNWEALSGASRYASGVTYQAGSYSCLLTEVGGTGTGYHPTACCTDPDDDQDNTTGWTQGGTATISSEAGGVTGQRLKVAATGGANARAYKSGITLIAGKLYRLKVKAGADVGDEHEIRIYSSVYGGDAYNSGEIAGEGAGTWTTYDVIFECPSTETTWQIYLTAINNGDNAYFDNVSLNLQNPTAGSGMWQHVDSGITEFEPYELSWYALEGSSGVTYTYAVLDYVSGATLVSGVTDADSPGAWTTKRICNFTAPVDCTGVTVEFILSETGGTTCYFDTVILKHTAYPYEVTTSFEEDDLSIIKYAQSADILYLVHPDFAPQKLSRSGHTDWTLQDISFKPFPSSVQDTDISSGITIMYSTFGSGVTVTADAGTFQSGDVDRQIIYGTAKAIITTYTSATQVTIDIIDDFPESDVTIPSGDWTLRNTPTGKITPNKKEPQGAVITITSSKNSFRAGDIGKYIAVHDGFVKLYGYQTASSVTGEILKVLDAVTATDTWTLESDDWSASNGYPSCVEFFEERLYFAGSNAYPQTLWGSQSGDYENFTPGPDDSDAVTFTIAADQVNVIRWMKAIDKLLIGTIGGEWWMAGSGDWDPVTPSSVTIRRETNYGSQNINPIVIDNSVLFVQKPGKKIRRYGYNYTEDAYRGQDISILAEHLTNNYAITELAYQQSPNQILWALRADGDLLGLTYMPEHEISAWHRHSTEGDFESIAVIPGTIQDELWVIVERFIDGVQYRFVEQGQSDEWDYTWGETTTTNDATYPMDDGCTLLIESDTTDGSQVFVDSSPYAHTISYTGDIEHSTTRQKFGASSIFMDGINDYLSLAQHDGFKFGSGDFTIDFWTNNLGGGGEALTYGDKGVEIAWYVNVGPATGTQKFTFCYTTTGLNYVSLQSGAVILSATQWYHIAVTRKDGTTYLFVDGDLQTTEASGTTSYFELTPGWADSKLYVGNDHFATADTSGYLDEIRIVKGEAIWTSDFIPPARIYSDPVYATTTTETMTDSEAGFYIDSGLIYDNSYDIADISGTSPIIITLEEAHDIVSGDTVYIKSVQGMTELNDTDWSVLSVGGVTVAIKQDGTLFGTYTQGGTVQVLTNSVTGLEHLAGVMVSILADGNVLDDQQVTSSGGLSFSDYYKEIHAGLGYTATLETVDVPKQFGKAKRLPQIHPRFFRTSYAEFGPDTDHLTTVNFPSGETPFTGEMEKGLNFPKGWGTEQVIMFTNDEPLPMAISGIIVDYE